MRTQNWYGWSRWQLLGFTIILTSAFTEAWRNLYVDFLGKRILHLQLSSWDSSYDEGNAGIWLRIRLAHWQIFNRKIIPKFRWLTIRNSFVLRKWNHFVCNFTRNHVDRRYSKAADRWRIIRCNNQEKWKGITGSDLLLFK